MPGGDFALAGIMAIGEFMASLENGLG
jgi:hypothetical protein